MKKILLLALIIISYTGYGQTFTVTNIDSSNSDKTRAEFYAFDSKGNQIINFLSDDFIVKENGNKRTVTNVTCAGGKKSENVSIAISFDVSGSMQYGQDGQIPIELGKSTAKELCNFSIMPPTEFAIQTCNDKGVILQDFTTDKNKIQKTISSIKASGNNNFAEHLLNDNTGLLNIAKYGSNEKIAILISDAFGDTLSSVQLQRCKDTCSKYGIVFYVVLYSRLEIEPNGIKTSFKSLADATGGRFYDGIVSLSAANDIAQILWQNTQGVKPCSIEWMNGVFCEAGTTNIEISYIPASLNSGFSCNTLVNTIAEMKTTDKYLSVRNIVPGIKKDTTIWLTAKNADFNISNVTCSNSTFTVDKTSFVILKNQSVDLTISYTPKDSGYVYTNLTIESDKCPANLYIGSGYGDKISTPTKIILSSPNGGETLISGERSLITWAGIPAADSVRIKYSTDDGLSWEKVTDTAFGLSYKWNTPKTPSNNCRVQVEKYANIKSNQELFSLIEHTGQVYRVSWSPTGALIATCSDDNSAIIWDAATGKRIFVLKGHIGAIENISWSRDSKYLLTSGNDSKAMIWDVENGALALTLTGHTARINNSEWSPNGAQIATCSDDKTAIVWNSSTGSKITTLKLHSKIIHDINWSPDGKYVATASEDSSAIIWNANTGARLFTLKGFKAGVKRLEWSPTGALLAVVCLNNEISLWNTTNGSKTLTMKGHTGEIYTVKWSKDGKRIVSSSEDNSAIVWNCATGAKIFTLSNHTGSVIKANWSPNDSLIATASWDYTAKLWNSYTGTCMKSLEGHTGYVYDVCWSPDGQRIATSSSDNIAKVWTKDALKPAIDKSDGVFSIAVPTIKAMDLDMGKVSVNFPKDSLVVDFITNSGTCKVRLDSVYITGTDASAFKLVGGFSKRYLEVAKAYVAEFSFKPTKEGLHNAQIVIITQADTVIKNIVGEGVSSKLDAIVKLLDFGLVLIGDERKYNDTIILQNTGSSDLTITPILNNNADNQFEILSATPKTLQPNEFYKLSVSFKPTNDGRISGRLGFTYPGAASPVEIELFGTGIDAGKDAKPVISELNFGRVKIGEELIYSDTLLIRNTGKYKISFVKTQITGSGASQFELISYPGQFELNPNEERKVSIKYKPYELGASNAKISFSYNGVNAPREVALSGYCFGGLISVKSDSCKIGESFALKVELKNVKPATLKALAKKYSAKIKFTGSILAPLDFSLIQSMENDTTTMNISGDISDDSTLSSIPMICGLGKVEETKMEISEFTLFDYTGNKLDFQIDLDSGLFKLLGICKEGGARLLNPNSKVDIKSISPNPAIESINIEYTLSEKGPTEFLLINATGEVVKKIKYEEINEFNLRTQTIELCDLSTGSYTLILKTPTLIVSRNILIIK